MKIVIDTNVVISGLISPSGTPAQIIDLWILNEFTVCLSTEIMEEYLSVLLRPKFQRMGTSKERYGLISELVKLENTMMVKPDFQLDIVIEDPDDNIFLECALEAKAEIIISGDDHLLNLGEFQGIYIFRPIEFLQKFFSKN